MIGHNCYRVTNGQIGLVTEIAEGCSRTGKNKYEILSTLHTINQLMPLAPPVKHFVLLGHILKR